jgi:hypothetical protein
MNINYIAIKYDLLKSTRLNIFNGGSMGKLQLCLWSSTFLENKCKVFLWILKRNTQRFGQKDKWINWAERAQS